MAAVLSIVGVLLFAATARAEPSVSASPASYDFGTLLVDGEYSFINDYIEVENDGTEDVVLASVTLAGDHPDSFTIGTEGSGYCAPDTMLTPGDTCSIDLGVQLGAAGDFAASVQIETSVAGVSTSVPLLARIVEAASNSPVFAGPTEAPGLDSAGDGSQSNGLSAGDITGDGVADVIGSYQMGDFATNRMGLLLGNADGTLDAPIGLEAGGGFPGTTAVGHFDSDEDLDAVVTSSNEARIYLNDGMGSLIAGQILSTNQSSGSVTVGDFDEDGSNDLAVSDTGELEVFLGLGDGSFGPVISQQLEHSWVINLVTADFEGDGSSDLGYTNSETGGVVMLKSDGDGSFTELDRVQGCGCQSAWGLGAADLNADGRDDLVATVRFENLVSTYISRPDGQFDRRQSLRVPFADGYDPNPIAVALGDLNADGLPDAATANYLNDTMSVLVGEGDGTFGFSEVANRQTNWLPNGITIAQFGSDPALDISVGNQGDGSTETYRNIGEPDPVGDPTSVDFGDVKEGFSSEPRTIKLYNGEDGIAPLVVSEIQPAGGESAEFVIGETDCLDGPVLVGDFCSIEVSFDPAAPPSEVPEETNLEIRVNTSEEFVTVPLSGTVIPGVFSIEATPTSVDFGEVTTGQPAGTRDGVIANNGDYAIEIEQPVIQGFDAADFTINDGCDGAVLVETGDLCTIRVGFTPSANGFREAAISIPGVELEEPLEVDLSGNGEPEPVPEPGIAVQPGSLAFADTQAGSQGAAKSVEITSSGTAPLVVGAISLDGSGAGDFAADASACSGKTLAPGTSCSISLRFAPSAAGAFSASLAIDSNAGPRSSVALAGTGTAQPIPPPVPPKVTFKKKPKKKYVIRTRKLKKLKVAFKADQSGSRFQCKLDGRKFTSCRSPKVYKNLKPGKHTIRVRAVKAGQTGAAKVAKFKVVRRKR